MFFRRRSRTWSFVKVVTTLRRRSAKTLAGSRRVYHRAAWASNIALPMKSEFLSNPRQPRTRERRGEFTKPKLEWL